MNSKFWMTFVVRIWFGTVHGLDTLVCCELISFCFFIDGSTNWFGTVHVRLVRKFQPAPCYPKIFKIYLCLVVLQQLPPSQHMPCYSKITTPAETPTSCEIPTRKMLVIPLNRKNRLGQIGGGTFVTYPIFRRSASLRHGSPLPSHPPTHSYTEAAKTREAPHPPPSATQPEPLPRRCPPEQHLSVSHPPY